MREPGTRMCHHPGSRTTLLLIRSPRPTRRPSRSSHLLEPMHTGGHHPSHLRSRLPRRSTTTASRMIHRRRRKVPRLLHPRLWLLLWHAARTHLLLLLLQGGRPLVRHHLREARGRIWLPARHCRIRRTTSSAQRARYAVHLRIRERRRVAWRHSLWHDSVRYRSVRYEGPILRRHAVHRSLWGRPTSHTRLRGDRDLLSLLPSSLLLGLMLQEYQMSVTTCSRHPNN